ncbi:hypothetical protein BU26DRAFT_420555 [Trematosphaeria pertusa]|uniref:Uncharacterized protein n=1 Tax=Trematosphaeria pertusa TaxID=390896 RepID=A0A6A6IR66_9PLEO|nr:uncharacterized protein BU26DRAFT_420555 [Trematosphaeria pertusa]KAF2253045.1 hypothetical protein BU26DRAFT_420555 [Trematosphaeria pertusa]
MFITADLFGCDPGHDRSNSATSIHTQTWNAMVDSSLSTGLGKRKRRSEDCDGASGVHHSALQRSSPASKGFLKLQGHDSASFDGNNERTYPLSVAASTYLTSDRRPVKQMRRLNPKVSLVKTPSHLMDIEPDLPPSSSHTEKRETRNDTDLRPCHACKTAPKRKRDLENYMECKRCDGRTCYICARECLGCRKAICKKCIVEVGQEGDPWCLECYSRHINT